MVVSGHHARYARPGVTFLPRLRRKSPELRRLRRLRLRIEQKEQHSLTKPSLSAHMTACAYLLAVAIGTTLSIPRPSM
jgi:hypothetical protein